MSDAPPPISPDHTRFVIELKRQATPGELAAATGVDIEHVGHIHVDAAARKAWVDVANAHWRRAHLKLRDMGFVLIEDRHLGAWCWIRIAVGRNHGVTLNQIKKVLGTAGAAQIGRIELSNTHLHCGVKAEAAESIAAALGERRLNGYPMRPEVLPADARRSDPAGNPPKKATPERPSER